MPTEQTGAPVPPKRDEKSHWILGMAYINADDPRLLVPLPSKLGWAVNFGNPRATSFLFWLWVVWLAVFLVAPLIVHPSRFSADPTPVLWVAMSNLLALGLVRASWSFRWSDLKQIRVASHGLVAMSIGFFMQTVVNGPLVLWWGAHDSSRIHQLILATVAGIAQTAGKLLGILLLFKTRLPSDVRDSARYGLLVGLGFAISEITLIYFSWAWGYTPEKHIQWGFLIGVWERGSAALFHINSAGLVALALWTRRYWLIGWVVAVHALTDFLAGAGMLSSAYALEGAISICAASVWVTFPLAYELSRRVEDYRA
ncbi:MAG TPA: hypothetical protein VK797_21735 [Tepidisphaeraceae bacterium]|jgi:hypothetical protein|nr:hypothetical protein [Tepidisphaeraceae bacterium]